jgi:hypothetical protein
VGGAEEAAANADGVRVVPGELLMMRLQEIAAGGRESEVFLYVIDDVEVRGILKRNLQRRQRTDETVIRH